MAESASPQAYNLGVAGQALRYAWALPNTAVGALVLPLAMRPGGQIRMVDGVIEASGPLIDTILRRCVPIDGGASAITFGHIVLGRDGATLEATRQHERVHVRQCETWGPAFIPAYLLAGLWAWITGQGAYEGNWFERQARDAAAVPGARETRAAASKA